MRIAIALATVFVFVACPRAHAEERSVADRDSARAIARRGAVYFDNKEWDKAAEQFRRAYEIVQAPTLALMEARALVELGRLVDASRAYSRAVSRRIPPENAVFQKAQSEAGAELALLRSRIPSIEVAAPSSGGSVPHVRVDGLTRAAFASIPLDPGTHLVSVQLEGTSERSESVTLREGEHRTIVVEAPAAPIGVANSPARTERAEISHASSSTWMWAAFGLGAAGLATGVVAGALALDRKATLDGACQDTVCPPALEPDLRDYRTLRTVSLVGYAAGVVGTAGGLVLFAGRPKEPSAKAVTATLAVWPSGLVVSGDF